MRISARAQEVAVKKSKLAVLITQFQADNDLTDIEVLQTLADVQQTVLKYMLRAERHPDNPDKGADEA